ncbi:MAG: Mandelate racemase/muconate lactonizing protein [Verrucomicrobia bacterium]|nr:Mandelate racemase/muconate lactonizing protein [Verrucomicrobiota bacterium]
MSYRFDFRRYHLPFQAPLRTAHGPWREREGVMVRLTDAQGNSGYGEAAPIPWFGTETVDEAESVCRGLGEHVTPETLASLPDRVACLKNALAAARRADDPELAARKPLGVAALLPAGRAALGKIGAKADAGFRIFKWKVGVGDADEELGLLDDVCATLPDGAKLRLDANGAWDRRQAERWLERCADRPVEFVEQPSFAKASEGASARRRTDDLLLGLAGDFPTPLALDESIANDQDVERWLGLGWPGVFVVKPALLADVEVAVARLSAARADVVFSSALETLVGARAALAAAFTWTGKPRALGFGVWPLFADSRFDGPYERPFLSGEDVARLNPETAWTALN